MSNNYLDLKQITESKVKKDYFPFFTVNNSLLNNIDSNSLINDFPDISEGGSFPIESNAGEKIKELIQELEGQEFKALLEDKFDVELNNEPVVTTLRGYSRLKDGKIHTDSSSLVHHLESIWMEPLNWWNSSEIQNARVMFNEEALGIKKNWLEVWGNFFKKELDMSLQNNITNSGIV